MEYCYYLNTNLLQMYSMWDLINWIEQSCLNTGSLILERRISCFFRKRAKKMGCGIPHPIFYYVITYSTIDLKVASLANFKNSASFLANSFNLGSLSIAVRKLLYTKSLLAVRAPATAFK